jgi:hypothetical protein
VTPASCAVTLAAVLLAVLALFKHRPDVALLCALAVAFQSMDLT